MRTILCSLVLLVSAAPVWCAPAPVRPDAAIENDIRARFQRSKIRVEGFTVKVHGGVALIEGKTKVIQRKGAATRLAKLGGARAVENKIQVDESARLKAANNLETGRRRAQVKRSEATAARTP